LLIVNHCPYDFNRYEAVALMRRLHEAISRAIWGIIKEDEELLVKIALCKWKGN